MSVIYLVRCDDRFDRLIIIIFHLFCVVASKMRKWQRNETSKRSHGPAQSNENERQTCRQKTIHGARVTNNNNYNFCCCCYFVRFCRLIWFVIILENISVAFTLFIEIINILSSQSILLCSRSRSWFFSPSAARIEIVWIWYFFEIVHYFSQLFSSAIVLWIFHCCIGDAQSTNEKGRKKK